MSLLEDYRKKKAEDASKENAGGRAAYSGSSLLDIYKDKKTYESFESGEAQKEINAILGRYQNALSSYYDTANKQLVQRDVYSYNPDAAQWNEQSNLAISGIEALKGDVYDIISKYEKHLDGDFIDQIYAGLDSDAKSYGDIAEAYKGQSDFYGSFADEGAYNKWYEGYKESERIKNLDVDSATKELEALKKERGRYTNTSNIAATHLKALGRTNAVQRFRYEQALSDEEWLSANDPDGVLGLTIKDRPRNTAEATALHQRKVEALTAIAQGKTDEAKVRDYDDRINALERDITNAQRIQNGIALHNDAVNAEDFEKYVQEGIGLGDDIKFSFGGAGYKNDVVGVRNEAYTAPDGTKIVAPSTVYNHELEGKKQLYLNMTEEEVNIYSYYLAKYGKKKAEEYLDSITETVNNRIANKNFANLEGNTALELFFGVAAGLDQFASGIDNLFSNKDYIPQSHTQMTSGMVREDLEDDGFKLPELMGGGSIAQAGYDAITTTANMMPSILTSLAIDAVAPGVGGVVGSTLMGGSAAGNAYAEMLNLGYSKEQARGYSLLVGGSEALLQTVIGGIGSLGASAAGKAIGGKVGGALTSGLTETLLKNVDNAFARFAIKYGTSMISEGGEEYLQEVLDPVFKNLVFNENNEVKIVSTDAIYSGILGALSAGMLEGVSIAGGEYNVYKTGKTLQGIDGAVNRLAEIGKTFSADSVAHRLANKVNENTGAYTIGRLFMEEGAVLSEQNLNTITDALIKGGVDKKSAKTLAKTFARVVEGATLTDSQKAILENCDPLTSAIRESIIVENTTVYKRTQSYKQVYNDYVKVLDKKKHGKNTEAAPAVAEKTEQTLGVRGEFTSNNDGKTTLKTTGEEVSIKEIASIHDGDVVLALDNGKKVNARDVVFKSENEALVYEGLVNAGYSIPAINAIAKTYDGKTGATEFLLGVREQYEYGALGFSEKDSAGAFSEHLDDVQKRTAFEVGRIDKAEQVRESQEQVDRKVQAAKEQGAVKRKGEVVYEGNVSELSKRQKTSIKALNEIAKALGVKFVLFESYENQDGKLVYTDSDGVEKSAPNGWYDPATGEIHIDVFAGEDADGTILFTAAHELTHMIKEWSPQKYEIFKDFLLARYSEKGISVEQLVANQIAKAKDNGRDIGYDEALEEVVADSCESFLVDSEAIAELRKKDATLREKIKSELKKLLNKIKALYKDLAPDSDEGKYVRQMKDSLEELYAMWTDALVDAGESYSALAEMEAIGIRIGEARGLKDAPKKADVKYSERKGSSTEKSVSKKKDVENMLLRAGTKVAQKYREDIASVDELKAHLAEVKEQMNTEHSSDLRDEVIKTQNRISVLEKRIARTEFSAGLVLENKTTLAKERNRVEMRDKKAALKKQIRDSVKRLNTLLNKGTKEKHVKSGQQDLVSSALALAKVFFGDVVLNEDLVRYVDLVEVSERESRLLAEYKDLLDKRDTIKEEIDALEQDPSLTKEEYLQLDDLKKELEKAKQSVRSKSAQLKEVFERARAAYNKKTAQSLVEDLQREYKKLESSEDDFISNAYSAEVYERLEVFKNNLGQTSVRSMNEGQLSEVLDAFKMIEHSLKKANALFREGKAESLEEWLKETRSQLVENGKEGKDMPKFLKVFSDVVTGFFWNELKPYYAVERTGSDRIRTLFWDIIEGEQRASSIEKQARDFLRESKKKHNITKKVLEQTKTFTLPDGKTFTLKVSDMMSIYAYSKREQAHLHMLQGGFVFGNDNTYKKTADFIKKRTKKLSDEKVKEFLENVTALEYTRAVHQTPYVPGEDLLKMIVGEISGNADYKGFADDLQNFMTDLGQLGNETSNKLYGVDLFKEKFYIPLRSAKDYLNHVAMEMGDTVTSATITNMGMTKQTVPDANNPIVLESLEQLFADHVSQMASYASLAVPVDNMRRVLTFKSNAQKDAKATSMLALMESYMGSGAKKYFDQYLKDVNGNAVKATGYTNPLMGLFGRAKKVQVAANLSVAIQQPSSILRATAVINPKYLLSSLGNVRLKSTWEELQKYAPIAITKEIGGFDVGSNGSGKRYILSDEYDTLKDKAKAFFKDSDYRDDLYMSLATLGDEYGWGVIWNAVKKEAADTTKLKVGSKDYFEHCKKRFTEIIVKTQVYDSVNARSGMMRSQNDAVKFATSFMGEPTVTVNMLMDSATKLQRADETEKKQAGKAFAATVASVITSALVNNALKSVIYAMRDEDEDETLAEKYLQALGKNVGSDINPLNWLPIARDIISIAEGWSVDRPDMSLLGEVVTDSTDIVSKMMKDEDVTMKDILNLAGTFGNFAGIPAENAIKDVKAIANTVIRMFDDINQTDLEDAWGYFYKGLSGKDFSEDEMLYDALRDGDEERVDYYKRDFEERDVSFETKVKSAIKKQYVSGKISKDQVKDDLISYLGYDPKKDEDEIFWIIREWDYSKTKKKDDEDYEKYADFYSAVKSGKDLKKTIKFYTDHGVEKQTLASNITREFKPLYKEMTNKERAAIKGYLLNAYVVLGYDRSKKSKDIDGWLNEDED